MRIGIISDTHDNLKNVERMVEILNEVKVERVIHTGDITKPKTLAVLAGLHAPLFGVYGNNDLEREELEEAVRTHEFLFVDPPLELHWHERRIVVVHDPTDHTADVLLAGDVLLHGHDHFRRIEHHNGTLIFNPGECAGQLLGLNAVGVLELGVLEPRVLFF